MASAQLCEQFPSRWAREGDGGGGARVMTMAMRRRDVHKRGLLEKEQEKERRRIEETIQGLHAIEDQRRRARERKLDRERRRDAYAELLERSALTLQRCERGRLGRRAANCRYRAAAKLGKWMIRERRRKEMIRIIKKKTILRIVTKVETIVEERITEACFVISQMVEIQRLRKLRSAKIIQYMIRERAALHQWSADIIGRAARCWIARANLRRARIRRSILRHRGSLSRRARGLPEPKSKMLTAASFMLSSREVPAREGRWWNAGPAILPRPRWGNFSVKDKEGRSRPRAASLSHLIKAKRLEAIHDATDVPAVGPMARPNDGHLKPDLDRFSTGGKRVTGFGSGTGKGRRASMLGPREAEAAALKDEMMMAEALRKGPITSTEFKKLTVREKHLIRQMQFEAQKEKRRRAVEEKIQRKEREKTHKAAEEARQRALELEISLRREEEREQLRKAKLEEYQKKKEAKDIADRKAAIAKRDQERHAREQTEAERCDAQAAFEERKAQRLEQVRRKRRPEEDGSQRSQRESTNSESPWTLGLIKKAAAAGRRRVLAPIETRNPEEGYRKRQREGRLRRAGAAVVLAGVWRSKAAAKVHDGKLKLPYGSRVPALPIAPGWKEMPEGNDRGDRKRVRRRSPRQGEATQGGVGEVGGGRLPGVLRWEDIGADLKQLLAKPSEGQGLMDRGRGGVVNGTSVDSTRGGVGLVGTGAENTSVQGSAKCRVHHEAGEAEAITEGDEGSPHGVPFADKGVILETLESAFPVPGSAAGSGGDGGLGATSPLDGASPRWSSYGSPRSEESQALGSVGGDSEGKALSSCCVAGGSTEGGRGGGIGGGGVARDDAPDGDQAGSQHAAVGVKISTRHLPVGNRHPDLFEYASGPESSPRSSLGQTEEEDEEEEGFAIYRLVAALLPLPLKPVPRADGDIAYGEAQALALGNAASPPGVPSCDSCTSPEAAQRVGDVRRYAATTVVAAATQAAIKSLVASSRGDIASTGSRNVHGDAAITTVARSNVDTAFREAPPLASASAARPPRAPCCGFSPSAEATQRAGDARSDVAMAVVVAATQAAIDLLVVSSRDRIASTGSRNANGDAATAPVAWIHGDTVFREAPLLALGSAVSSPGVSCCDFSPSAEAAQRVVDARRDAAMAVVVTATQAAIDSLVASSRDGIASTGSRNAHGDATTTAVARIDGDTVFREVSPGKSLRLL